MPPAIVVGSSANDAIDGGDSSITFAVPSVARARDALIAVVVDVVDNIPIDSDSWELLATWANSTAKIWVFRHEVAADDPSAVELAFVDPFTAGIGVLLAIRNTNVGASVVSESASTITASTNFVCPSRGLSTYSDLYLGFAFVETNEVAVAPPAGATEIIENQYDGKTLEAFAYYHEAIGPTGTKTATTGANQSGVAASIALAADPLVGLGKSFVVEPAGTFGLPSFGV